MDAYFNVLSNVLSNMSDILLGEAELTQKDIVAVKSLIIKDILLEDVSNHDYTRIQKIFEGGHISNNRLVNMVDKPRFIDVDFREMIFIDMANLLCDEIMSNPALDELFVSVYSKKYTKATQIAQENVKNGSEDMKRKMDALSVTERHFCLYLLIDADNASGGAILDCNIIRFLKLEALSNEALKENDYEHNMEQYQKLTFSETEDRILLSRQFERFLSKRKCEIAEYLGVEEKDIPNVIVKGMDFSTDVEEKNYLFRTEKLLSRFALMEKNGGLCWLSNLAGSGLRKEYYYQPDVDQIIRSYYTVQVIEMHDRLVSTTGRFAKLDLSRGWETDCERDVRGICHMYCLDVFYKMFAEMMKEYYKTFSWEKITSENMQRRYDQMANELNLIIADQKNQITSLGRQISLLKLQSTEDNCNGEDKVAAEYERQNGKLIKEIEQKDKEIIRLKDYIKSQEEFLALQSDAEPDEATVVDEDSLRARRYLFVGSANEALPDLRRKFPGSVFMQSENTDISNISVDAIIFLTKWMSHAMFYKVRNSGIYQKVPSAMCNTKNINRIFYDMDRQLSFD